MAASSFALFLVLKNLSASGVISHNAYVSISFSFSKFFYSNFEVNFSVFFFFNSNFEVNLCVLTASPRL